MQALTLGTRTNETYHGNKSTKGEFMSSIQSIGNNVMRAAVDTVQQAASAAQQAAPPSTAKMTEVSPTSDAYARARQTGEFRTTPSSSGQPATSVWDPAGSQPRLGADTPPTARQLAASRYDSDRVQIGQNKLSPTNRHDSGSVQIGQNKLPLPSTFERAAIGQNKLGPSSTFDSGRVQIGQSKLPSGAAERVQIGQSKLPSGAAERVQIGQSKLPSGAAERVQIGQSKLGSSTTFDSGNVQIGQNKLPSDASDRVQIGQNKLSPSSTFDSGTTVAAARRP